MEQEDYEPGPFSHLGQATNERGFSLFRGFNPFQGPGPFGGLFTQPLPGGAPSPNVIRYSGEWRVYVNGSDQGSGPAASVGSGSFNSLTQAQLQAYAPTLLSSIVAKYNPQGTVVIRAVASNGAVLAEAGLTAPAGPGQLKKPSAPGVDPRAALWRFEAQVKKCPQCPSEIVATESSSGLITAEQAWQQALALKGKTKAQWIITRRQRKQGEPKAGEWFSVWIPTATLAHLKNLEP